jgi:hypothetical protein
MWPCWTCICVGGTGSAGSCAGHWAERRAVRAGPWRAPRMPRFRPCGSRRFTRFGIPRWSQIKFVRIYESHDTGETYFAVRSSPAFVAAVTSASRDRAFRHFPGHMRASPHIGISHSASQFATKSAWPGGHVRENMKQSVSRSQPETGQAAGYLAGVIVAGGWQMSCERAMTRGVQIGKE